MAPISWVVILLAVCFASGCLSRPENLTGLPSKYEIEVDQLRIQSDVKIASTDPLIQELKELRSEITETLKLPSPHRPVVVHLFGDEERYRTYMTKNHPNLPPRRAFFIGTSTELAVYAHWSPSVEEDLRHEYTHCVLHASLRTVPLWFDEGLAEYFETRSLDPHRRHPEHMKRLGLALTNGWRPDLNRLEQIETVAGMQRGDYQESWAWIHYLLHDAPDGKALVRDYCQSLRSSDKPPRFSSIIHDYVPDSNIRLASYLTITLTDEGAARLE